VARWRLSIRAAHGGGTVARTAVDRQSPLAARSGWDTLFRVTAKVVWKSVGAMIADARMAEKPAAQSSAGRYLLMRQSEDGWSLLTPQGELVFRARGLDARRRSLEVACERGALAVLR
jgi:hypothetical protein